MRKSGIWEGQGPWAGDLKAVMGMVQAAESDPSIPPDLRIPIKFRVSQLNGCLH